MDSNELAAYVAKRKAQWAGGMDPEALSWSAFTTAKAHRFLEEGRVAKVERDLWRVEGDTGTYLVRLDRHFEATGRVGMLVCSCPLSIHHNGFISWCSHSLAALITATNDREQVTA